MIEAIGFVTLLVGGGLLATILLAALFCWFIKFVFSVK